MYKWESKSHSRGIIQSSQSRHHFHAGPIGAASALPIGTRLAPPLPASKFLVVVAVPVRCATGFAPFSLFVLREVDFVAAFSPETLLSVVFVVFFIVELFPDEGFVVYATFFPLPRNGDSSEALTSSSIRNSWSRGVYVGVPALPPSSRAVSDSAPERLAAGEFESMSIRLRGLGRAGEYA